MKLLLTNKYVTYINNFIISQKQFNMGPTNKTSRRKFLGNTAAIGAIGVIGASQLIRSCSSGEKTAAVVVPAFLKTAPEGQPLKAGVVGCGGTWNRCSP